MLGDHVNQAGSLVAPDRLRFDFTHFEAVTPDELERVEGLVNAEIFAAETIVTKVMPRNSTVTVVRSTRGRQTSPLT